MDITDIRTLCTALPAVTEDVKWGHDLVFSVGGKMFCVAGLDRSPTSASFKVRDEEFGEWSEREGFKPAPYMAKHRWVWVDDITRLGKREWKERLQVSHELVAAKLSGALRKRLGLV